MCSNPIDKAKTKIYTFPVSASENMKKKSKFILIDYKIYPFNCLVAIGATQDEIVKHLKNNYNYKVSEEEYESLYMRGLGRTSLLETGGTVMRLKEFKNTPACYGTLAHEVFHAVEFLFDKIRIKHHIDSSESFAYLIQYITEEILKKLK